MEANNQQQNTAKLNTGADTNKISQKAVVKLGTEVKETQQ